MCSSPTTVTCYLGLGSNQHDPCRQIKQAIIHLDNLPKTEFIVSAPWYRSKAWGVTDQNDFINTVIQVRTALTPMNLLKAIKKIEYRLMQRQLTKKWHSRNIDIDILLYGRQHIKHQRLHVPHLYLTERCFVLEPLLSLKPQLSPQTQRKIKKHQINHKCKDSLIPVKYPLGIKYN